ncbi:hypothetical protein [Mucilaginibacter sp. OK098]|uniref:hypothetical protein n=1 Tax=Mucilaginibacter sp. OK098 TaxID=1855297 RepID=UPI000933C35C|nr:hypothetical protein [Mucilaginibacter sp. OK098]
MTKYAVSQQHKKAITISNTFLKIGVAVSAGGFPAVAGGAARFGKMVLTSVTNRSPAMLIPRINETNLEMSAIMISIFLSKLRVGEEVFNTKQGVYTTSESGIWNTS